MNAAAEKLLTGKGYELAELAKALFGKDTRLNITVENVAQDDIEFMHDCNPGTKFKEDAAHITGNGFSIVIESIETALPF